MLSDMSDIRSASLEDNEHMAKWPWGLSFQMLRCPAPAIAWSNCRLPYAGGDEALLREFAWQIPTAPRTVWPVEPRKTFYAECYGGDGVQYNGGGVRGAWHGDWLVKGCGTNLLSGYSDEVAATYRRNGRASNSEMLVEAIWGEVLHYALPYGAVRMTAVIRTGETLKSEWEPTGAMGVRQFAWRPASVMRAPAFRVRPENRALIPHDTARVKEAIARLPELLPMPATLSAADIVRLKPRQRLMIGLEEMVRRFGEQMAAAKAKRLSHGTLNTSNLALDGRWNDLHTVSALPGYGYRRNLTPFWNEQASLLSTIELICFFVKKYFPARGAAPTEAMPTKEWLTAAYERFYTDALHRRFVSLCGYPQNVASRVWATQDGQLAMRNLAQTLISLARSGHSHRRPYPEAMQESQVAGDYDLPKILRESAGCQPAGDNWSKLRPLIGDEVLRNTFSEQYRVVEKMMFKESKKQGIAPACFARLVAINCHKAGHIIPQLFNNLLYQKCILLAENKLPSDAARSTAEREIDAIVDLARMVYQEPRNFRTLLWCAGGSTLEYDARFNVLTAITATNKLELPCAAATRGVQPDPEIAHLLQSMRLFWGDRYEEIIK